MLKFTEVHNRSARSEILGEEVADELIREYAPEPPRSSLETTLRRTRGGVTVSPAQICGSLGRKSGGEWRVSRVFGHLALTFGINYIARIEYPLCSTETPFGINELGADSPEMSCPSTQKGPSHLSRISMKRLLAPHPRADKPTDMRTIQRNQCVA